MSLDPITVRRQFPALDRPAVFFDNPGGTQIARPSLERIQRYLSAKSKAMRRRPTRP